MIYIFLRMNIILVCIYVCLINNNVCSLSNRQLNRKIDIVRSDLDSRLVSARVDIEDLRDEMGICKCTDWNTTMTDLITRQPDQSMANEIEKKIDSSLQNSEQRIMQGFKDEKESRKIFENKMTNLIQDQTISPVHGGWTVWEQWGVCSQTCATGLVKRSRQCANPYPGPHGNHCFGDYTDTKLCLLKDCTKVVHGGWSGWTRWGQCSQTCGTGLMKKKRYCTNPYPGPHGTPCIGNDMDVNICMLRDCPSVGEWFNWSSWTTCSPACGTNITQHRTRACNNTVYQYPCVGSTRETKQCSTKVCLDQLHNCKEILDAGLSTGDGLYNIDVDDNGQTEVIEVFCDMTTVNGGTTVFQYRFDGSVDFYKSYSEYSEGFGSYPGEFWLGLKWLHAMTANGQYILRVDLAAVHNVTGIALYSNFSIGQASSSYMLHVGGYVQHSTIPDKLNYHNGYGFSTRDHDVDTASFYYNYDCAKHFHGAFWYKSCLHTNINGPYLTPGVDPTDAIDFNWNTWPSGTYQSLLSSKLSFKPF